MLDSKTPDFWDARYRAEETPWDFGGAPAALKAFLKKPGKNVRVLIPGCGSGHDVVAFARAGYDVTALDFSAEAVAVARLRAGPELAPRIQQADFFAAPLKPGSFDVVYERTFLCSLSPDRREAYACRVAELLKPGGLFAGFFYYQKTPLEEGPPWGLAWGESDELFSRLFLLTKDLPVDDSLPVFAGRERWQEQRRTSYQPEKPPAT